MMGFNYERGLAEMIHDLGHRLESTMSRVYSRDNGGWEAEKRRNDWERFSCVDREAWAQPGGDYHLGYMRWLFSHLPRAPGRNSEGKLCNWWNYLFDMSNHPETR